jgi:hypothetical protein
MVRLSVPPPLQAGKRWVVLLNVTSIDIGEWVENMTDEDGRGRFHRLGLRLERLEATLGQTEKRLCDGFGQAKAYPEGKDSAPPARRTTWRP